MRVWITSDQFSRQREQRGSGNTSRTKRGQFPTEVWLRWQSSKQCSNYRAAIVAVKASRPRLTLTRTWTSHWTTCMLCDSASFEGRHRRFGGSYPLNYTASYPGRPSSYHYHYPKSHVTNKIYCRMKAHHGHMDIMCRRTALEYHTIPTVTHEAAARRDCNKHRRGKPLACHLIGTNGRSPINRRTNLSRRTFLQHMP